MRRRKRRARARPEGFLYDAQNSGIDGERCPKCFAQGFRGEMELLPHEVQQVEAQAKQDGLDYRKEVWKMFQTGSGPFWLNWQPDVAALAGPMTIDQAVKKVVLLRAQARYQDAINACSRCSRQGKIAHNHDPNCQACDAMALAMQTARSDWDAVKPR